MLWLIWGGGHAFQRQMAVLISPGACDLACVWLRGGGPQWSSTGTATGLLTTFVHLGSAINDPEWNSPRGIFFPVLGIAFCICAMQTSILGWCHGARRKNSDFIASLFVEHCMGRRPRALLTE